MRADKRRTGAALCDDERRNSLMLRRLLSILLFAATLLPLVAPMLSSGAMAQSTLPACCRRGGKHQCGMIGEAVQGAMKQTAFRVPLEQCPYRQHSLGAVHLQTFTPRVTTAPVTGVLHAPSAIAQVECLRRISFDRSRQKRGPPSLNS
jgi:hypothetical protein